MDQLSLFDLKPVTQLKVVRAFEYVEMCIWHKPYFCGGRRYKQLKDFHIGRCERRVWPKPGDPRVRWFPAT